MEQCTAGTPRQKGTRRKRVVASTPLPAWAKIRRRKKIRHHDARLCREEQRREGLSSEEACSMDSGSFTISTMTDDPENQEHCETTTGPTPLCTETSIPETMASKAEGSGTRRPLSLDPPPSGPADLDFAGTCRQNPGRPAPGEGVREVVIRPYPGSRVAGYSRPRPARPG